MIRRHTVKSCCNNSALILETETAIKKSYLQEFINAGYVSPKHYIRSGLFYVVKPGLVAEGSYGATKINIRVSGKNMAQLLNDFEKILDSLTKK